MIRDVSLVKVKALTKKMAEQIQLTSYTEPIGKRILEALRQDYVRPLAWASGGVIDGIPEVGRAWLIEFESQLFWMSAPYGGRVSDSTPEWMETCCKNLPQLFIG